MSVHRAGDGCGQEEGLVREEAVALALLSFEIRRYSVNEEER